MYEQQGLPEATVVVLDGTHWLYNDAVDLPFRTEDRARVTVGMVAFEGDRGRHDNRLSIDGDTLNPWGWTGTGTMGANPGNAADSTAFGSPFANSLGTDAKLFKSANVTAGDHTLRLSSGTSDAIMLSSVVLTIADR